jgi:hypothetical protein
MDIGERVTRAIRTVSVTGQTFNLAGWEAQQSPERMAEVGKVRWRGKRPQLGRGDRGPADLSWGEST